MQISTLFRGRIRRSQRFVEINLLLFLSWTLHMQQTVLKRESTLNLLSVSVYTISMYLHMLTETLLTPASGTPYMTVKRMLVFLCKGDENGVT